MASQPILAAGSGSLPELPTHRNPGLEIVIVREGELHWHVEGVRYRVPAGSVFFTFPWEQHGSVSEREPGHLWDFVQINVGGLRSVSARRAEASMVFGRSREGHRVLRSLRSARFRVADAGMRLPDLVSWAVQDVRSGRAADPLAARSLAALCLVELARCLANPVERPTVAVTPVLQRFLAHLREHCAEPWTLAGMASRCGLARTQFTELIRRATGDTPMEHLQRLRVERARELLGRTQAGITQIAIECGFCTSQHFARTFRRFVGKSASEFREQGSGRPEGKRKVRA